MTDVCRFDMNKTCDETCICDEDITEITDFNHLKATIEFTTKEEDNE